MLSSRSAARSTSPFTKEVVEIRSKSPKVDPIFNNKFYNRFYKQQLTYNMLQQQIDREIKQLANCKKTTETSHKIIIRRLENWLQQIVQQCNITTEVTFPQLGLLLTAIGVFNVVKFDQNLQLVPTEKFNSSDAQVREQRNKEMDLHDKLFDLVVGDDDQNSASTETVLRFITFLIDPINIGQQQTIELIYNQAQIRATKVDPELKQNIKQIYQLFKQLTKFQRLDRPVTPSKTKERQQEYVKMKEKDLTFKPQLNPVSERLDERSKSSFLNDISMENDGKKISRIDLLYKKKERNDIKMRQLVNQRQEQIFKECTFHPHTNVSSTMDDSFNQTDRSKLAVERLYQPEDVQNRRQILEEIERIKKEEELFKELKKCTFHPEINDGILYDPEPTTPRDFERTVSRMRYATEQQQIKKEVENYVPAGQGYESARHKPFKPPQMLNRQKQVRKPLFVMDINVAPRRQGRVAYYEDDDPFTLAQNFARTFKLTKKEQDTIYSVLVENVNKINQSKVSQYVY